jgi:hypothetical protein
MYLKTAVVMLGLEWEWVYARWEVRGKCVDVLIDRTMLSLARVTVLFMECRKGDEMRI